MKVIFSSNYLPGSIIIKLLTACRWHHCGVVVGDAVIEASSFGGVRKVPLKQFQSSVKWAIVDVPVDNEKAATDFLHKQLGKPYDWIGLLGLMLRRRNWQKQRSWYCSELVAAAASAAGTKLVRDSLAGVTQRDLWVLNYPVLRSG